MRQHPVLESEGGLAMTELEEALLALRVAENHFNEAATPNQVDMAIFEYNEALDRYEKALRKAKAERTA